MASLPDPTIAFLSIFGFIAIVYSLLFILREKNINRLPSDVTYNYEGSVSNPKLDEQVNRNAYLHTLAPSYKGAVYGLHNDRREKK